MRLVRRSTPPSPPVAGEEPAVEDLASVRTEVADVVATSDGIVEVRMFEGVFVGVDEMAAVLDAHWSLVPPPDPGLTLVDARPVRSMTRAAQELSAHHPLADRQRAVAILVSNPVSRILGSVFLRLVKPPYPTRLFALRRDARAWLLAEASR